MASQPAKALSDGGGEHEWSDGYAVPSTRSRRFAIVFKAKPVGAGAIHHAFLGDLFYTGDHLNVDLFKSRAVHMNMAEDGLVVFLAHATVLDDAQEECLRAAVAKMNKTINAMPINSHSDVFTFNGLHLMSVNIEHAYRIFTAVCGEAAQAKLETIYLESLAEAGYKGELTVLGREWMAQVINTAHMPVKGEKAVAHHSEVPCFDATDVLATELFDRSFGTCTLPMIIIQLIPEDKDVVEFWQCLECLSPYEEMEQ